MKLVNLAASLAVALFCIQGQVRAQEEVIEPDEAECLTRWEETKASIENLIENGYARSNYRVAEKCEKLWTTPEQKALHSKILQTIKDDKQLDINRARATQKISWEDVLAKAKVAKAQREAEELAMVIENQKIKIGMNRNEVRYRMGYPEKKSTITMANGVNEIWIYDDEFYVVFRDDKLISIHEDSQ